MKRSHPRRDIESRSGHAQLTMPPPRSGLTEKLGESDGTSLCLIAATFTLFSSVRNFHVSLSSDDGLTNKEYSELVTGTMEVATCFPYICLTLHESVPNLLPTPAALAPLKLWITCRPDVRIFRNTTLLVVMSYLILLDINLGFACLAIFPVMAIVFIGAIYRKFIIPRSTGGSDTTPGSPNVVEKTASRKTTELKMIVIMTLVALFVMDQLPDHAAEGFPTSQFLLFLSSTVAALTRMMTKLLPAGASLPGVAPASEMLHKTLLVLLLVTVHTVAAEWLGEDVVLLCLPEFIPVLLWLSLHVDRKPGSSSIISMDKIKPHRRKSLVFIGAVVVLLVAALFAYPAISMEESGFSGWCTTFMLSCGVSGILTYYLVFMLSHWTRQQVTASGMLMLWAHALLVAAAASLLLSCLVSVRFGTGIF